MPLESVLCAGVRRLAAGALVVLCLTSACATSSAPRHDDERQPPPALDRNTAAAVAMSEDLVVLQKLVEGAPAEQAEIAAAAQRDYESSATPARQLRLGLVLATPGHPATDLPRARRLLGELVANPQMLPAGPRALAFLELQRITEHLNHESDSHRLQAEVARADREKQSTVTRRMQLETDENARLRKELEEARAKLDAIANIERSLNERKPSTEGPQP